MISVRHAVAVAALACLLPALGALPGAEASSTMRATAQTCASPTSPAEVGSVDPARHLVVLVHGWTGTASAMATTASMLEERMGDQVEVRLFDYARHATDWAARATIAPCLADHLRALSDAHRAVGGDGKVFVVAHSMGGLVTLFSTDPSVVATPVTADELGGLVTLDTPFLGSPFGGTVLAEVKEALAEFEALGVVPAAHSDAGQCLQQWSAERELPPDCATPGPLPSGVPLHMVAGVATVERTLFGQRMYDVDLASDGIVWTESMHGYLTGHFTSAGSRQVGFDEVRCTVTSDQTLALLSAARAGGAGVTSIIAAQLRALALLGHDTLVLDAVLAQRVDPLLGVMMLTAGGFYECGHSSITVNDEAIDLVADALTSQLDLLPAAPGDLVEDPSASVWPESRDDGPPALYVWLGANMMEFPDWVACDAARDWCLLGGSERHTLVRVDGLEVVGTLDASLEDPFAGLRALGLRRVPARQILGS